MSELKRLERELKKSRSDKERLCRLEDIADYYHSKGNYEESLGYYEEELSVAKKLNDQAKIAHSHRMIGEVKVALSECEEALKHTKTYYDYARSDDSRLVEQQRALTTLGRTYFVKAENNSDKKSSLYLRDHQSARKYLWMSLKICEKLENEKAIPLSEIQEMRAISLLNLGLTYEGTNEFREAEKEYNCALRICRKHNLDGTLRRCCIGFGSFLIRQKKYSAALEIFNEALATAKDNKDDISEIWIAKADAHLSSGDIPSSRKALQKAYHILKKSPNCSDKELVVKRLQTVAAIDYAQRQILQTPNMSPTDKLKKYEVIADGFANLGFYSFALLNYEKMLEHCKIAESNLKDCYMSLAQTCMDLKKYEDAIAYYELEIPFCSPKDACLSLISIHECEQQMNVAPSEQLNTLEKALGMAEAASNSKLKKKILMEIVEVQKLLGSDECKDTQQALENLGDCSSDSEESEDEECTPNIGEYIDLDMLSDYSMDEGNEEFDVLESTTSASIAQRPKRNTNRTKAAFKWKNEKGETKLHVACIHGKVNAVRTLLEQGHNVNAVDYGGWTPLHEACNRGFLEIVDLLIQHGANIDYTSPISEGITPLCDAASNGEFEVMEFLLDKNASVNILTVKGESALDILMSYYEKNHSTFSSLDEEHFRNIRDRLQASLDKIGCFSNPSLDHSVIKKNTDKGPSPRSCSGSLRRFVDKDDRRSVSHQKRTLREVSPVSSPESPIFKDSDNSDEENVEGEGVSEYVTAIKNLRKPLEAKPIISETSKKTFDSLLPDSELVDDWLEDDVGKQPSKKRRRSDQSRSYENRSSLNNSYKPLSVKRNSSSRLSLNSCSSSRASINSNDVQEDNRFSTGSMNSDPTDIFNRSPECVEDVGMEVCEVNKDQQYFREEWLDSEMLPASEQGSNDAFSTPCNVRQSSLFSYGVTRQHVSPTYPQFSQPATINSVVKVKVDSYFFAVHVSNPSLSIGWLAEKAAKRYLEEAGCLPILSIYSSEDALFSNDDPVSMVLGTTVTGKVQSWSVSSTAERYREACQSSSTDIDSTILSLMEAREGSNTLEIPDGLLKAHQMKPVFRAISMELSLSKINLSNNALYDEGVLDLSHHLAKLSNLKELNLSGNNISAEGVCYLATAAQKGGLKVLQKLNLSHNHLGDASISPLADLTKSMKTLQYLSLADCMFTKSVWDKCDQFLSLNMLQYLDLSSNQLHAKGLAGFLGFSDSNRESRLNPEKLQTLHLVGLGGERLCQEVLLFLEQGNSIALRELHISYTAMKDDDLTLLLSKLRSAPEFHSLRLPAAQNISFKTVSQLLLWNPPLKELEIHNSKNIWKTATEDDIIQLINHVALTAMETLTMKDIPKVAADAWRAVKGYSSTFRRGAFGLQVFGGQSDS